MEARILEHDEVGEGDPPFVLFPGGLTGWDSWLPLVPALAESRRVVRVQPIANAEGVAGRTGDGTYDAAVERESLRRTLDAIGVGDMHLVGWSNGGRMALDFALAEPDRVRTLTAIEPAAWWLVTDRDESARQFEAFLVGCAGRELGAEDVQSFLRGAGVGSAETDFTALPHWDFWMSCRQVLSWYDEKAVRSLEAGIEGLEELGVPVLLFAAARPPPGCGESSTSWTDDSPMPASSSSTAAMPLFSKTRRPSSSRCGLTSTTTRALFRNSAPVLHVPRRAASWQMAADWHLRHRGDGTFAEFRDDNYDKTYGTLGGLIALLVWLWISNLAILFGHELNAELEREAEIEEGRPGAEREIQLAPRTHPR